MAQRNGFCALPNSKCNPVSQTYSRDMEIEIETPNPYKPRPRRRTNIDRYEPNKGGSAAEQSSHRTKRSKKRATMMKRNTSRVDKKFHARNVKAGRLTLASNAILGIFRKGKTSEPVSCPQLSYPKFSETEFLRKETQPLDVPEERTQESSGIEGSPERFPIEYYSDAFIETHLLQSLGSCQQLSMPYEEYSPVTSNDQFISLEDLKELYNRRNHIWRKRKRNSIYDNATRSPGEFHAENLIYNRMENRNTPPLIYAPDTTIGTSTTGRDIFLDICLETVKDFDEDMAMEYLAELIQAEERNSDNCEPQLANLHAYSVKGLGSSKEKVPCTSLRTSKKSHSLDNPIPMIADTVNKSSANLGIMQKQRDEATSFNALDSWHHKDMERDIIIGDCDADITYGLDGYQFGRRATPVCTTNRPSMPTSARPDPQHAETEKTTHRRFWRRNKLY